MECELLRALSKRSCTIRLSDTGAVLQIELRHDLDITRAAVVCALKPVKARVELGPYVGHQHVDCTLLPEFSSEPYGPPARFVRRRNKKRVLNCHEAEAAMPDG
jgi:hypothetical protein